MLSRSRGEEGRQIELRGEQIRTKEGHRKKRSEAVT
jgi:hypothetical protein